MIGRFEDVSKRIGNVEILKNINLEIDSGVTLIAGPNGSGKSSLIKLLVGFWRPSSGRVTLLGRNPWNNPEIKRIVGISIDPPSLPKYRKGKDLIKFLEELKGIKADRNLIQRLFPYTAALNRPVAEYSSGMKKRLSILLALLGENELLILDEPFSGLDVSGISEVARIIKQRAANDTNMIILSHLWRPIYNIIDRTVVLVGGEVAFAGERDEGIEFLQRLGI
ncbi:ABC-type multidrug transport system, ATPase component [Thermococcus kodakarensis KOD1]|uniref:ABC-type multidrug transport system, ATPase component n=1 Tax=Thermococcus kodakarensis (strain ATCC BAA-918 / JCM 12380 / KOD1) TaxID=69014 RepID=Q5JDP4_THEKO|nr:ABC transporter ATP-binding protein [Thermococcus kodakarensis]WCN27823.1 ABC transporter ATP-binding protein [Thermococcus kodakarensis]WCN30121.1 ABC transporter ATP-binding protein [Thermococcus kodakarensis]BAD86125.1 ABC-type multidrug transport system, ATPase component [Thermococcus kodakarensis KOD1]